ncbi:hypothetical protein B9Z55_003070 [Caenorhabditis nigoni]|uniref:EB domain-containing protein n=1 Tax=Caenorhabditis nigoni TaxID=1611254 RepID=A0A2G5VNG9_9PELO|nr:hypothetical protein B9Z55_003070 [Caenorhabditis nigoni]
MKIFSILLISFLVLGVWSQEFSGMMPDRSCERDADCIGSKLCNARQCRPISSFRKCDVTTDNQCGKEYTCHLGVCRYIPDIFEGQKHSFGPNMKCTHRSDCPHGMSCTKGNCT